MKEYNVLEAPGLCMNGNPVDREISQAHMYGMKCDIQNTIRSYDQKLFDRNDISDHQPKGILNTGGVTLKEFHNAARSLANAGPNPFKN